MPVKLSRTGAAAVGPGGKIERRFKTRAQARAYVRARGLAEARRRGYRVPPPRGKGRKR